MRASRANRTRASAGASPRGWCSGPRRARARPSSTPSAAGESPATRCRARSTSWTSFRAAPLASSSAASSWRDVRSGAEAVDRDRELGDRARPARGPLCRSGLLRGCGGLLLRLDELLQRGRAPELAHPHDVLRREARAVRGADLRAVRAGRTGRAPARRDEAARALAVGRARALRGRDPRGVRGLRLDGAAEGPARTERALRHDRPRTGVCVRADRLPEPARTRAAADVALARPLARLDRGAAWYNAPMVGDRLRRTISVCALGGLLGGCAVGPDYQRPELTLTPAFRDTTEAQSSIADSAWFDVFSDPVLRQLVDEALANNRDLKVAVARVEQARYTAAIARSPLFPQIGYGGTASRGKQVTFGQEEQGSPVTNSFLVTLAGSWEIDVWGRIRRSAEAGRAELLATDAMRRGVVLSLVSEVAQAYFELRELDLELLIATDAVASFQDTYDLFNRRFTGGVTSKLDPLRAEASLAQVAALKAQVEQAIVFKENQISVLVGRPPAPVPRGAALEAQTVPPEIPVGVPAQLLERRPDLIESEQQLVAANAQIGATFANYFPRIGLTALGGSLSTDASDLLEGKSSLWSYGARAAGPLFTAGQTTYLWKGAKVNTDAMRESYEGTVLNALREVSDALTARRQLALVREQQQKAVTALEESLKTARTRYSGGLANYLEVLNAQQQLYPAQLNLAQTRRDELLAVVALYRALGGGWSQNASEPSVPTPLMP